MPASISTSFFQRKGEDYNNMEQISIIERFPYPFQVGFHCTLFAGPLCLLAGPEGRTPQGPGVKHGITAPVPGVTQMLGDSLLLSTLLGTAR